MPQTNGVNWDVKRPLGRKFFRREKSFELENENNFFQEKNSSNVFREKNLILFIPSFIDGSLKPLL